MDKSLKEYIHVLEYLPVPVLIIDAETKEIVFVNKAACRKSGYTKKAFSTLRLDDIFIHEHGEKGEDNIFKLLFKSNNENLRVLQKARDGKLIHVEVTKNTISNNRNQYVALVCHDITSHKQIERKLLESETKFRTAAGTTVDLIWEGSVKSGILQWYGDIDGFLGYESGGFPRTIEGHMKSIHPDDYGHFIKNLERSLDKGKDFHAEYRIRCKDGSYRYWKESGKPVGFENGNAVVWVGAVTDITESKRSEELLLLSERDWEDTFNTIPDMITIHDMDFNILRANKPARDILGINLRQGGKAKCFRYYHGSNSPPEGCPSCSCLKTRKSAVFEIFEPHLDKFIEIRAIPRFDIDGKMTGLIHVVRDISGKKEVERTLAKKRKELSDKAEELLAANTALKVLLNQRDNDRQELEDRILSNIQNLVMPYLEKLRVSDTPTEYAEYVQVLKSNLKDIVSSFSLKLSSEYFGMTPKEIQVANLIKEGKQSKEIAEMLNMSFDTVNGHRQNIRKKLGLNNKKTNLRAYLHSLSE